MVVTSKTEGRRGASHLTIGPKGDAVLKACYPTFDP